MRKLPPNASSFRRISQARYVARRLLLARRVEQAGRIRTAADRVRDLSRAVEDQSFVVYELKADRDGADATGDIAARDLRHGLAAESRDAVKQAPYIRIIPDGIEYYTAAPLYQQVERYTELKERITTHLPEDHPLRAPALAAIETSITAFQTASTTLAVERRKLSELRIDLDEAEEDLEHMLERTWGALVADLGKDAADGFYPRATAKKEDGEDDDNEGDGQT